MSVVDIGVRFLQLERRDQLVEQLRELGYSERVREFVADVTAPLRHEWRVRQAWETAYNAVSHIRPNPLPVGPAFLLWLEGNAAAKGIGGKRRYEPFRGLGKGRRWATDGDAWTAAILASVDTAYLVYEADGVTFRVYAPDRYEAPVHELARDYVLPLCGADAVRDLAELVVQDAVASNATVEKAEALRVTLEALDALCPLTGQRTGRDD